MNKNKFPSNKNYLYKEMYKVYCYELNSFKIKNILPPLHYYSFRVYLAYINFWKIILRHKIKPDELNVMLELGCYKPSRVERGTRIKPESYIRV
jgi:hypothetical protein